MTFPIRGICPLLQVFDMPTSLAFYRDVLEFELVQSSPSPEGAATDDFGWAWLRRDDTELMLNTLFDPDDERPAAPDAARVAAHDDTILYIGCPDVDAAYRHLSSHGITVAPPRIASYGMKQLYVKDPDGFGLCFQWKS